jgi:hypothetical protein
MRKDPIHSQLPLHNQPDLQTGWVAADPHRATKTAFEPHNIGTTAPFQEN